MFTTRVVTAAAMTVATAALVAGCAGAGPGSSAKPARSAAAGHASASASPAALPAGISPLGSTVPIASQGWTLSLQPFQQTSPVASVAGVPAGWPVLRTQARFTNTSGQIAQLPATVLTVRYGALGRAAVPVKDATLTGLPSADADVKEVPGGTFTAEIGVAVPPQALGQRVTVTAEATEEGMAEPDDLFYEGTLPGKSATSQAGPVPAASASQAAVLLLGSWSPSGVRVSPVTLGAASNGTRQASLDLTVANDDSQPKPGIGVTLHVMTGTALTDVATLNAGLDYSDAPIAPQRTATVSVRFTLPASAVPGPVTVEAVDQDGTRATYSGTLG